MVISKEGIRENRHEINSFFFRSYEKNENLLVKTDRTARFSLPILPSSPIPLPVEDIGGQVLCDGHLPLVPVGQ